MSTRKPAAPGPTTPPATAPATDTLTPAPRRPSLLTPAFRLVLVITLLAWGMEAIVRALLPLMVLDRGGDAVMVGLVATAYSLPSLLFRPIVGSLVDGVHHRLLLRAGMIVSAVVPVLLLLPSTVMLMVVRFLAGTGWAFFTVSDGSLMAKLAPPNRRAEASGLYMTMPALAQLLLPGLGVALYTMRGDVTPILFAVALGLAAVYVTFRVEVPPSTPHPPAEAGQKTSLIQRFVEPSALPGTLLLITSYSASSVFAVFAPVYAQHVGSPVAVLIIFYPIYGFAQAVSQPVLGKFADRLGRAESIAIGCGLAAAGLLIAIVPVDVAPAFVTFTIGAFIYGLSQSLVNPTISALVIERAPRHRLGSAMATYSIGYQFSTGMSSLLWGAIITSVDFTWLFVVAVGLQALTFLLSRRMLGSRPPSPAIT